MSSGTGCRVAHRRRRGRLRVVRACGVLLSVGWRRRRRRQQRERKTVRYLLENNETMTTTYDRMVELFFLLATLPSVITDNDDPMNDYNIFYAAYTFIITIIIIVFLRSLRVSPRLSSFIASCACARAFNVCACVSHYAAHACHIASCVIPPLITVFDTRASSLLVMLIVPPRQRYFHYQSSHFFLRRIASGHRLYQVYLHTIWRAILSYLHAYRIVFPTASQHL